MSDPCLSKLDLEAFLGGDLSPADVLRVTKHLKTCAKCRIANEALSADDHVLDRLKWAVHEEAAAERRAAYEPKALDERASASLARQIQGYEIIRELKRGGQGVVYEAIQLSTRRKVALKPRHGAFADERSRQRFEREIELAAALQHPYITPIYDRGVSETHPYYAMAYIDGKRLDDYLRTEKPSIDHTLTLFSKICAAIGYAHQQGVIHRDLKPSNILIDDQGDPHLLDFGLARDLTVERHQVTLSGEFTGTFAYAAPEQVGGERGLVGTSGDVYALGVILYEALTGQLPYRTEGSMSAVIKHITQTAPQRPSRVSATLKGDLEVIVLKALVKDPAERYQSVAEFAKDVQRLQNGEPIAARPPSGLYQLQKLVQRNKAVSASIAVVLLVLVGWGMSLRSEARRTAEQRDKAVLAQALEAQARAEAELQRDEALQAREAEIESRKVAERINLFLQEMLASVQPGEQGKDVTVRTVLDRAAKMVEEQSLEPAIEAALRTTIGNTYLELGLSSEAELHLRRALDIRRELFGDNHPDIEQSVGYLVKLLIDKGDYAGAEPVCTEAVEMGRVLHEDGAKILASDINNLGLIRYHTGQYAEAELLFREALAMRRKLFGDVHEHVAHSLSSLAGLSTATGDYAEAEGLFREALAIHRQLRGDEDPNVARALLNVAHCRNKQGDYEEAEKLTREALAINRRLLGDDHPQIAISLNNLATQLQNREDYEGAEPLYDESLQILLKVYGPGHPGEAFIKFNLGRMRLDQHKTASAEPLLRDALAIRQEKLPAGHWLTAKAQSVLGECLADLGRYEEAETLLVRSYPIIKDTRGESNADTTEALKRITHLYQAWNKPELLAQYNALLAEQPVAAQAEPTQ